MKLNEIKNQNWNTIKDIKVSKHSEAGVNLLEQELHINSIRCYDEETQERKVVVCCSDQTMITELSKCEFFTLKGVLISTHPRNYEFILEVAGELEPNGLTIRKKKHEFTEEEKRIRSERAKINFSKHKTQRT